MAYALLDEIKMIKSSTLDDLGGHWQPVRSAIVATAGFLVVAAHSLQIFVILVWTVLLGQPSSTMVRLLAMACVYKNHDVVLQKFL